MSQKRKIVRPVSVTVFAILAMVFGSLNVISAIVGLLFFSNSKSSLTIEYPDLFNHYHNGSIILLNLILAAIGFMLLKFHPASRKTFIYFNMIDILNSFIVTWYILTSNG